MGSRFGLAGYHDAAGGWESEGPAVRRTTTPRQRTAPAPDQLEPQPLE
ncbi:hypothetical protein AB0L34_11625 [Micromonospora sp. NPDC052213]